LWTVAAATLEHGLNHVHDVQGGLVVVLVNHAHRLVEAFFQLLGRLILVRNEHARRGYLQYEYDTYEQTVRGQEALVLFERSIQAHETNDHARYAAYDQQQTGAVQTARVYYLRNLERLPQSRKVLVILRPQSNGQYAKAKKKKERIKQQ